MSNNPQKLTNWVVVDKNGEVLEDEVVESHISVEEENSHEQTGVEVGGSDSELSILSIDQSADDKVAEEEEQFSVNLALKDFPDEETMSSLNSSHQSSDEAEGQSHSYESDSDLIHLSHDEDCSRDDSCSRQDIIPLSIEEFHNFQQNESDSEGSLNNSLELVNPGSKEAVLDGVYKKDVTIIENSRSNIQQYKHNSNVHLNVVLTILFTIILGLAIGHFIGAGRQWIAQTKKNFAFDKSMEEPLSEQISQDSISFWQKKYKDQLLMNKRLKTILSADVKEMDYKEISKKRQEFHESKLDMISLQLEHLQILKDLQIRLVELQLKEHLMGSNEVNHQKLKFNDDSTDENIPREEVVKQTPHTDELIILSESNDLKSNDKNFFLKRSEKKYDAESHEAEFIPLQSEENRIANIKIVETQEKNQDDTNADVPSPLPFLPPPPPENILNALNKNDKPPSDKILSQSEKSFVSPIQYWMSSHVDNRNEDTLVKTLQDRIFQLQKENNELRDEMSHLRYIQQNPFSKKQSCQKNVLKSSKAQPFLKRSSCPSVNSFLECNNLFNLSFISRTFHKFPQTTENLIKKLNYTTNIFSTLQQSLANKWLTNVPFIKLSNILHQTWNEVKNISKNLFVKKESTIKKLAKKVSEKLGHLENTLGKKWIQLNEKIKRKFSPKKITDLFTGDFTNWKQNKNDKMIKRRKKEKKYMIKIETHCNKIMEKIKKNKTWFSHIQKSKNPYDSEDFKMWLKNENFFEIDNIEIKELWKSFKKLVNSSDQKEFMWLVCQFIWWQENENYIDKSVTCQKQKNQEPKLFENAKYIQEQQSKMQEANSAWFFTRAQARNALRESLHPKSEWLFERAKGRQYQRLFHRGFHENSWKIYDWLNKRAEIRRHLRYLEEFD